MDRPLMTLLNLSNLQRDFNDRRDGPVYRISVDYHSKATTIKNRQDWIESKLSETSFNYPKLIGLAVSEIGSDESWVWCVGEIRTLELEMMSSDLDWHAPSLKSDAIFSLVAYRIHSTEISQDTIWPVFLSQAGLHLFLMEASGPFEDRMQQLAYLVEAQSEEALERWRDLYTSCAYPHGLARICEEVSLCVQPDDPHYTEVSFCSSQIPLERTVGALRETAKKHDVLFSITTDTH